MILHIRQLQKLNLHLIGGEAVRVISHHFVLVYQIDVVLPLLYEEFLKDGQALLQSFLY